MFLTCWGLDGCSKTILMDICEAFELSFVSLHQRCALAYAEHYATSELLVSVLLQSYSPKYLGWLSAEIVWVCTDSNKTSAHVQQTCYLLVSVGQAGIPHSQQSVSHQRIWFKTFCWRCGLPAWPNRAAIAKLLMTRRLHRFGRCWLYYRQQHSRQQHSLSCRIKQHPSNPDRGRQSYSSRSHSHHGPIAQYVVDHRLFSAKLCSQKVPLVSFLLQVRLKDGKPALAPQRVQKTIHKFK